MRSPESYFRYIVSWVAEKVPFESPALCTIGIFLPWVAMRLTFDWMIGILDVPLIGPAIASFVPVFVLSVLHKMVLATISIFAFCRLLQIHSRKYFDYYRIRDESS